MHARQLFGATLAITGLAVTVMASVALMSQERTVIAYEELAHEATSEDVPDEIEWDALTSTSPHVVAWCKVEGTSIDLPVCQATEDDPGFWLTHDLWGEESPAGTPYIDHRATAHSTHIMCYGHHLTGTGGMFSEIYRCYGQGEFDRWLTGDLVWTTLESQTDRLRPLCASSVDMDYADIQHFDFESASELRAWLHILIAQSSAKADNAAQLADNATRAITLVTCSSNLSSQRTRTIVTFVACIS